MLAALETTLSNMNGRLQQLALHNHEKDLEISRMKAAADVMQSYRSELEQKENCRNESSGEILASPVKRLWLKSPFGKSFRGKVTMSPKKTIPANESHTDLMMCESVKRTATGSSLATVSELSEKIRQTDSILEKTRLEAISSAFHLENAKEVVKSLTEEITMLRKQNQELEMEETKRQSLLVSRSSLYSDYLSAAGVFQ